MHRPPAKSRCSSPGRRRPDRIRDQDRVLVPDRALVKQRSVASRRSRSAATPMVSLRSHEWSVHSTLAGPVVKEHAQVAGGATAPPASKRERGEAMFRKPIAPFSTLARDALPRRRLVLLGLMLAAVVAGRSAAAGPEITLENLDGRPYADWLSFNRIENRFSRTQDHDQATLRIRNTGTTTLTVSQLLITGPWQLEPAPRFPPASLPPAP